LSGAEIFNNLTRFFSLYENAPAVDSQGHTFRSLYLPDRRKVPDDPAPLRAFYEEAFGFLEREIEESGYSKDLLGLQRDLYTEFEHILSSAANDQRHHFLIVIPVADRPLMLRNCLFSLIKQCRTFSYGGSSAETSGPRYRKVSVFVFDDSMDGANIRDIREICTETAAAGVRTFYIGIREQAEILRKVPPDLGRKFTGLIGDFDGTVRQHKGASLMRNIASLYIHSLLPEFREKTLIWFVDSDEEFMVKIRRAGEIIDIPFINYFYWLDRIFTESDAEVLTGKVVGDPPVTPAVMINTFLDDIICFFERIADIDPEAACIFHDEQVPDIFSAEYHDMVKLFGYRQPPLPKKYPCILAGDHSVLTCFGVFSDRALGFFYGLHPTRTQFYSHGNGFAGTTNARTVYTGNYVISPAGLRHFIPFAALGLRMAGPTLGRILRGKIGGKFVSANLPLLHRRTAAEDNINEFRSGVVHEGDTLDLSEEFLRQFWGDVMLFSVESLSEIGYPEKLLGASEIADTVRKVQDRIWRIYIEHEALASEKLLKVRQLLSDPARWWNIRPEAKSSVSNLLTFTFLVEKNFGHSSMVIKTLSGQIADGSATKKIITALNAYYDDERTWNELLKLF
jgi:hypothetical protein